MKIGFIGLGNVGGKLAGSLLRNKFDVTVRDLDSNLVEKFKKLDCIKRTTFNDHIKRHYFFSHESINPTRIIPIGPIVL